MGVVRHRLQLIKNFPALYCQPFWVRVWHCIILWFCFG